MAKRGELQLRVFCIYKRPAALRSKKSAAALQHFYFLLGMMCHGAWGVPARSVLHLQKTRCLEGAGKAALELDAACPSLTRFQFHVYSNASCGRQFQTSRRFFGPYKKQRGLRNSRSTPAGTASRPFIHPYLKLSHASSLSSFTSVHTICYNTPVNNDTAHHVLP